jgi:hypothetical protein
MEAYDSESTTLRPVSLAAGRLFLFGSFNNLACSGTTLYDAAVEDIELAPGQIPDAPPGDATSLGCNPNVMPMEFFPIWPPPQFPCPIGGGADATGEDGVSCSNCQDTSNEAEVLLLRNGRYFLATENQANMSGARFMWSWPSRPDTCLSPADPCGDPALIPGLVAALEPDSYQDFWVASDGSAALLFHGARLLVLGPEQGDPLREAGFNAAMMGDIIGVRYHPDAHDLAVAMQAEAARAAAAPAPPPPPPAPESCYSDTSCSSGQVCHGNLCGPTCERDLDCLNNGICGAFCGSGGRCLRPSEGFCDDAHPCRDSDICQDGRCVAPPPAEDEE